MVIPLGREHMIEGYADELGLFLKKGPTPEEDIVQFSKITEILNNIRDLSGQTVNTKKAQILPFGKKKLTMENSYWLLLLNVGIPSKKHRNLNVLLSFGETTLTKTILRGKYWFSTKVW